MEYAIEIDNLKKTFTEEGITTQALRGISLKIPKGQIYGLLGPNGAGKTTTLHILSTLITPTSGTATILGHDILKEPEKIREITGKCMGATSFLWDMTPKEILKYYSLLFGLGSAKRKERVETLIKDLEITKFQNAKFGALSTGMKQKVAVAKSLLNEPKVLFLDEPTNGLDVEIAIYIRKYIADLVKEKGMTVILTSHRLSEVEELCEQIAIIDDGKIVTKGSIADVRTQVRFPNIAYFCLDRDSGLEFLGKIKGVHGYDVKAGGVYVKVDQDADIIIDIISELKKRDYKIMEMELKKPSLEDVFLKIVRKRR
jgi:ABC-2 type transport system ATP-binding protein